MTERPDLHAWASAEGARRAAAGPGASARWRAGLWQAALVALIAGAACSLILFCIVLQQVWLLGSLLQAVWASYWAGIIIWAAIAAIVLLSLVGVLSRWWLLLPPALLGWGAWLAHDSVRSAETIAVGWRFEAGMGARLAAPLPVPRGTPPFGDATMRVAGLNAALIEPRRQERRYAVTDAPCRVPPIRTGAEDERPAIRRLAPLLRSLERRAGWPPGALCIGGRGPSRYTIEQRAIEGEGSWANPVRGVETTVWTDAFHPPVARIRQGEIDALAAIPFVSVGCRYGSNAEATGCGWFALTRPAVQVR